MNYEFEQAITTKQQIHIDSVIQEYNKKGASELKMTAYANLEADSANKRNRTVCKHYLRDQCKKGDACDFIHEYRIDKIDSCKFKENCTNYYCIYNHGEVASADQCKAYERGFCVNHPCKLKHTIRKMCPNYLAGFCPLGPDCKYHHPQFDQEIMVVDSYEAKSFFTLLPCKECGGFHEGCNMNHNIKGLRWCFNSASVLFKCPTSHSRGSSRPTHLRHVDSLFPQNSETFAKLYRIMCAIEASIRDDEEKFKRGSAENEESSD